MSDPYLAELRIISFNFPPKGWALCNGQLLPINQNQALFSLLGTTYGGDGRTTFALPNLRGATAMHVANAHPLGEAGGESRHQLTLNEMPTHNHGVRAGSATATAVSPSNAAWANSAPQSRLYAAAPNTLMAGGALGNAGSSAPHNNMPPYVVLNVVIALVGIYPSRN